MKKIALLLFALFFVVTSYGQIVVYDFDSGLSASSTAANVGATDFAVSDGTFTSTSYAHSGNGTAVYDGGSWNAVSPTKYYSFTITPNSGYEVSLTGISFDARQTASAALDYTVTVGGSTVASGTFTRDSSLYTITKSITLSSLSSGTEVRIYGYNGGSGNFEIDNVTLSGAASAVPEPSTYALIFGAATLGFCVYRRRAKRVS